MQDFSSLHFQVYKSLVPGSEWSTNLPAWSLFPALLPPPALASLEPNQEHSVCSGSSLVLLDRLYSAWLSLLSLLITGSH